LLSGDDVSDITRIFLHYDPDIIPCVIDEDVFGILGDKMLTSV
jgi:hypothetical protein